MSIAETVNKVEEGDWIIVPKSSIETIEVNLGLCTSLIFFSRDMSSAPYLVVHSGAIQAGGIPATVMLEAVNAKEFKGKNGARISLLDILNEYKAMVSGRSPYFGVYAFSGLRALPTDLAILRYFILADEYTVLGAELNQAVTVRLFPSEDMVRLFEPLHRKEILGEYKIGNRYPINLR